MECTNTEFTIAGNGFEMDDILCDMCDDPDIRPNYASHGCLNCVAFFCQSCKEKHIMTRLSRAHSVLSIFEFKLSICPLHRGELLKICCVQCRVIICAVCAVHNHLRHDLCDLKSAALQYRQRLENSNSTTQRCMGKAVQQAATKSQDLEAKAAALHLMVDSEGDKLIGLVCARKAAAHALIDSKFADPVRSANESRCELKEIFDRSQSCDSDIQRLLASGSDAELFLKAPSLLNRLTAILESDFKQNGVTKQGIPGITDLQLPFSENSSGGTGGSSMQTEINVESAVNDISTSVWDQPQPSDSAFSPSLNLAPVATIANLIDELFALEVISANFELANTDHVASSGYGMASQHPCNTGQRTASNGPEGGMRQQQQDSLLSEMVNAAATGISLADDIFSISGESSTDNLRLISRSAEIGSNGQIESSGASQSQQGDYLGEQSEFLQHPASNELLLSSEFSVVFGSEAAWSSTCGPAVAETETAALAQARANVLEVETRHGRNAILAMLEHLVDTAASSSNVLLVEGTKMRQQRQSQGKRQEPSLLAIVSSGTLQHLILDYQSMPEVIRSMSICRTFRTACNHPSAWWDANFWYFSEECQLNFWYELRKRSARMKNLVMSVGIRETEVLTSLLQGVDCSRLTTAKIYAKEHILWSLCNRHNNPQQSFFPDTDVTRYLQSIDGTYNPENQPSVPTLSLLSSSCSQTLTTLGMSFFDISSSLDLGHFQSLTTLDASMICGGIQFLEAVSLLPRLRRLTMGRTEHLFEEMDQISSPDCVLRSASLEIADLSKVFKYFKLADVVCPQLKVFKFEAGFGGWYSPLRYGDSIIGLYPDTHLWLEDRAGGARYQLWNSVAGVTPGNYPPTEHLSLVESWAVYGSYRCKLGEDTLTIVCKIIFPPDCRINPESENEY